MAENQLVIDVPLSKIRDFLHHPYLVKDDESMDELVDSIKERGLIQPVLIRPVEDGMYEMVSGHRRKRAFEIAGYEAIPARVKEMTRDEAILSMVDSNLQRETVLPSEKARAYKMRLDAMKRQGKRTDLTLSPTGTKLRSDRQLADKVGESRNQIQRLIRLNYLVPEMLEEGTKSLTDTDKFKSYLDVQSRFDRYSVSNAILVTHQMPEATKLGDSKYWQEQGVYINKGEKAITILEPGKEFTREDGTTGVSYNAKKVFDITQTNAEDTRRNRKLPNENILIKILVKTSPVPVEIRSDLPEGIPAIYDSEKNEIHIMQGMTAEEIFRALSKEIAHAGMDKGEYNREANEFTARAVSYITCRRMGFEPEGFEKNEKLFEDRSTKEIRKELSRIRSEANSIITSMEKTIEARARNRDAR